MMCYKMVPTRREYKDPRYPPMYISPVISVTQSPFVNLFIKIRQIYQLPSPVRLQILVSVSTLLCMVLFH